jgi:predicted MFS family arabinose efflux permease
MAWKTPNWEPSVPGTPLALLPLLAVGIAASLNLYATQPLLPLLGAMLGVGPAAAALTVSAPSLGVALAAPLAGAAADRLGRRRVIVASLLALVVPTLLAATSRGLGVLVAWRFLQGVLVPGAQAVAVAFVGAEWRTHGVGRAMGALILGNVLGGFSGRVVSAAVAERGGWRASFLALAALVLFCAVAAARWLPRERPRRPSADAGHGTAGAPAALLVPAVLATFASGFGVLFTLSGVFTYVTFHLAAPPFALGPTGLSWMFAVYLVGGLTTPWSGRWVDRVGPKRAVPWAWAVCVAGGALTLAPSLPAILAGLSGICIGTFTLQSASTTHLNGVVPEETRSVASGAYVSSYYIGGAAGGVLPALVWSRGGWPACLLLIGAVQAVTLAAVLGTWRPHLAPEACRA